MLIHTVRDKQKQEKEKQCNSNKNGIRNTNLKFLTNFILQDYKL